MDILSLRPFMPGEKVNYKKIFYDSNGIRYVEQSKSQSLRLNSGFQGLRKEERH